MKLLARIGLFFLSMSGFALAQNVTFNLSETPFFEQKVKDGQMPPVAQRIPQQPLISDLNALKRTAGTPGGTLRMLIGDQRNINLMTLNSYTRLVVYNENLQLVPDILQSLDVDSDRIFTLHLRKGHKWSDGQPFTTEDFRYYWEDVANNKQLNSGGIRPELLSNGKAPVVTIIDETTIRYEWPSPNPSFLPTLASAQPLVIYLPAHYLKQFHAKYADKDKLTAMAKEAKLKDWAGLHERRSRSYRPENPDLPTLDAWVNTTPPPSDVFTFVRNPYYHRIASNGWQLPYIDKVRLQIVTGSLIPAKASGGDIDLQASGVLFDSYTILKQSEQRGNYTVRLWNRGEGAYASLVPNLNAQDPQWRALTQDVRFRRALSLAINRKDINKVVFFGLAQDSANTMIPESPLFKQEFLEAWSQYQPDTANKLLDEIGLTTRDVNGTRLLPDGNPVEFTVETAGENTNETDIMELVADDFRKLGIRAFVHSAQRDLFRRRIIAGETVFSMWPGLDNGLATPDMEPNALAPANSTQFNWPQWGKYVETSGKEGEKITLPAAQKLVDLLNQWRTSSTQDQRRDIWDQMLKINAEQVFLIGIVNHIPQPIVVSNHLQNVPTTGVYSFEPGAFFGTSRMDLFWFQNADGANVKGQ